MDIKLNKARILDAISERIIFYDTDFKILWANRVAGESAGMDPRQMVGRHCYELWLENKEPCPDCPVYEALRTGRPRHGEISTPDGKRWHAQGYPVRNDSGVITGVVEVTMDITRRKLTEEALAWEVKVHGALAELSGKILSRMELEDIPLIILEYAKELTGSEYGFVGYMHPETGQIIVPTMTRDIWDECGVEHKTHIFNKFGGLIDWVTDHKKPLLTNSPGDDPRSGGTPAGHIPIKRLLCVPAIMDGVLVGLISLANSPREYQEHDLELARRLAELYAMALHRKGVEEMLQRANEDLEIKVDERTRELQVAYEHILLELNERKNTEKELLAARQQLMDIIEFLPDATFVVDRDKRVIAWNRAIEEMTGITKKDILGKGDYAYSIPFYGDPRPVLVDMIFDRYGSVEREYDYVNRKGDTLFAEAFVPSALGGKGIFLWATASPLFDSNNKLVGAIETIRDISERKRMEHQLQHLSTHDYLTNIPNRYTLENSLVQLAGTATPEQRGALVLIGLDNFKLVNDSLGHAAGDELLVTLVGVLRDNLPEGTFIARFSGDKFAVLFRNIAAREAISRAEKLRRVVDEGALCLSLSRTCFNLTVSVGIVMIDGYADQHKLLSIADAALYRAKESGRNRVILMEPDEDPALALSETNKMVGLVKGALRENRFTLYFQPVVRLADNRVAHHEALLRLRESARETIAPGRFIPVAERFGLMSNIDRWVVQSSFDVLKKNDDLKVFINVSGASLGDRNLLDSIEKSLRESHLEPDRIGFEITETAAIKDIMQAKHWIGRIKSLGCSFALDDFGMGFSSFSYLRMLPVDYLKIDGSFIINIDKDQTLKALVHSINAVAHTLGKKTIAEFVENRDIYNCLRELGVDYGQGYYWGKPSPHPVT